MKDQVRQHALELGFDLCRFAAASPPATAPQFQRWLDSGHHGEMAYLARTAPKRVDPQAVLPGANSIITLAASYALAPPQSASPVPLPNPGDRAFCARYARFADYHVVLGKRLETLARWLAQATQPPPQSRCYVDTGPVLERDAAQRAGLGFIGKHTNLINRTLGNWFFLAEILTTLELEPDPPEQNRCGTCTRCLAACPTQAILQPFQLDARRCLSYLTIEFRGSFPHQFRTALGNRVFGCDDCLAVCPWNRFAREGRIMKDHYRPDLATPDLLELLSLDEASFRNRFAQTPLLRAKRRGLIRNACVALGNVGDSTALPALARTARDLDPLIAEHAAWAVDQIENRALRTRDSATIPGANPTSKIINHNS